MFVSVPLDATKTPQQKVVNIAMPPAPPASIHACVQNVSQVVFSTNMPVCLNVRAASSPFNPRINVHPAPVNARNVSVLMTANVLLVKNTHF